MKNIRIGNDISLSWTITTKEGEPYSLEGKELMLFYSTVRGQKKVPEFTVQSNIVQWTFHGKDQQDLGTYTVTLVENNQSIGMVTIDYCEAFALVNRSCMTGGGDADGIAVETVELSTTVDVLQVQPIIPEIGDNGNWFINGVDTGKPSRGAAFTFADFTPEEILLLQKPALDAATSISELETAIRKSEQGRVLAESAREQAELLRQQEEAGRVTAETARVQAETNRETQELQRTKDETARAAAEQSRATAEQSRAAAEQSRATAELQRIAKENERISAEEQRQQAETTRAQKEATRAEAELLRAEAENARKLAEAGRVSAEEARVTEFEGLKQEAERATSEADKAAGTANEAAGKANEAADKINSRVVALETATAQNRKDIDELLLAQSDYAVGAWNADELAPESIEFYGKKEFLAKYDFYLLDTTDNAGEVTVPVGKLKRNNLLRFEDGSFAPTVGITEAQRAECDVALYLDQAAQQKYCDAGAFNAEAFYNEHGMAKLYNSSGVEVRVLRPWETTETKYTIGIGRMDTVYLLDSVKGESGKTWKGLFSRGMMWDGIDVSLYPLPPTVFGPGPSCTINNKTRNFFFVYPGETNCQSAKGQDNICTMFYDQQLTYPRVNDMHQVNNMTYARANNADPEASFPYAEGGYLTLNTYITSLEVYYGTKNLHAAKMFGSGISSNDTCNTEETWLENGGVRFKKSEEETWSYASFSEQKDIYYNATGSRTNFSRFLNLEHPKEACMESQMAASFAVETGVTENTDFEFYGSTYRYVVVPGTDGLASLNVRLYKVLAQTVSAYTAEGSAQSWDIEVNLRMSLYGGVNLSGDIYMYCGGGYETVGTCLFSESGSTGNPVEMYVEPDQRKWHSEKTARIDNLGKFGFESEYKKIGEATNLGNSYSALRQSFAPWSLKKGGSISTGECYFAYDSNYWSSKLNQRVRIGSRFRGAANYGNCSSRHLYAFYYVLIAYRYYGGSAQALVGAAPLQAE